MIHNKDKIHGRSFVVVSSDNNFVSSVERMLLFAGASVEAHSSGEQGLSAIMSLDPDAIIFDDSITDMGSFIFIKTLFESEKYKKTPVLIVADEEKIVMYQKRFSCDHYDYLPKEQYDLMLLTLRIEQLVKVNPREGIPVIDISEKTTTKENLNPTKFKVLVFEDDPLLQGLLSMKLENSQIEHTFGRTGTTALEEIKSYVPDLIIMDIMLPGKSGLEVLAELRDTPNLKDLPVIIFSNRDDDEERETASRLGVKDYKVKANTDLNELVNLIIKRVSESS